MVTKTGSIDPTQKSITVPPGSAMAPIKAGLVKSGWKVKASGARAATGAFGTSASAGEFQTRYVMAASMEYADMRIRDLAPIYLYDISILDTKTNEEVLNMAGKAAADRISEKLVEALNTP